MAKIKKVNRKGSPPPIEENKIQNLHKPPSSEKIQLKLYVDSEYKNELKYYALNKNISMGKLVEECFDFYKDQNKEFS